MVSWSLCFVHLVEVMYAQKELESFEAFVVFNGLLQRYEMGAIQG
jgi:hypothetical protein